MAYSPLSKLPLAEATSKRWTREEFRQIPENDQKIEWENGELIIMAAPTIRHQEISGAIYFSLRQHVMPRKLGRVVYEVEVDISDIRTVIPDVIFVSDENDHLIHKQSIIGGPDLIVEILSESTQKRDWDTKLKAYQTAGVKHYWIVSQDLTIWEFVSDSAEYHSPNFYDKGEPFTPKLFPDFSINLAALMGELLSEDNKQDE